MVNLSNKSRAPCTKLRRLNNSRLVSSACMTRKMIAEAVGLEIGFCPRKIGNKSRSRLSNLLEYFNQCTSVLIICNANMRASIVFLCVLVALLAIIFNRIYQRLFNVFVPDDFPKNSTWQFRIVGFSFSLTKDLVS